MNWEVWVQTEDFYIFYEVLRLLPTKQQIINSYFELYKQNIPVLDDEFDFCVNYSLYYKISTYKHSS